MKYRLTALFFTTLMLLLLFSVPANAEENAGNYGESIFWRMEGDTLIISGEGELALSDPSEAPPWWEKRENIKNIVLEEGITGTGDNVFNSYTTLENVSFPNTLISIGDAAFFKCVKLKNIALPENIKTIGRDAFYGCKENTSIVIPASIKHIGARAFFGWTRYDWIFYEGNSPTYERGLLAGKAAANTVYFDYESKMADDIVIFHKEGSDIVTSDMWKVQRRLGMLTEIDELEGWQQMRGEWRCFEDKKELIGAQEAEGYKRGGKRDVNSYYFNDDGTLFTGFKQIDGKWRYFSEYGSDPRTSVLGQMVKGWYTTAKTGYISQSEQAVIDGGKERVYLYFFDSDGCMYIGWHNDKLTLNRWRYFGEEGSSPKTSRLGRQYRYGKIACIGNNGIQNDYFFSQTGVMMIGTNKTGTYRREGENPATDALGSKIK